MDIDQYLGPARSEMPAVEQAIRESIASGDGMLHAPATHLLDAGGKRLRPALVLLSAFCCRYDPRIVVPAAAAVEMIHMATLIHDDIIDDSSIRRGTPTVNSLWGDKTALLTGDYLFARAFMMIAGTAPCALKPLSAAVNEMCIGQASETLGGPCQEEEYFRRIERKTALLMSVCCRVGSSLGRAPRPVVTALSRYGMNLGMAFQLVDDILDISGDQRFLGKPLANDLRQGILTLPVIHALKTSPDRDRLTVLLSLLDRKRDPAGGRQGRGTPDDGALCEEAQWMDEITSILDASGSVQYARSVAEGFALEAGKCLSAILPSQARDSLLRIPEFVLRRVY